MRTARQRQDPWAEAWAERYGDDARTAALAPPEGARRPGRRGAALAAGVALAALAAPLAVAGPGDGGGDGGAVAAGNSRGEPVEIQVRNRSRGETGLVTSSNDYSLRLSNTREGGGGGAVYGCRAPDAPPAQDLACLYADNLRGGKAFLFRSRQGTSVGHFDVGNPAAAPFTTNATGLVTNLNADKLDGLDAAQLQGEPGPPSGPAGGDLAGTYPDPTIAADAVSGPEIAANAVSGSEVQDRSLSLNDIAHDHSAASSNPASIAANDCLILETPFADDAEVGDLTLIVPRDNIHDGIAAEGMRVTTAGTFKWRICNRTEAAIDPPTFSFDWIVLRP